MSHRIPGFVVYGTKTTEFETEVSHRTALWDKICSKIR